MLTEKRIVKNLYFGYNEKTEEHILYRRISLLWGIFSFNIALKKDKDFDRLYKEAWKIRNVKK